MQRGVTAGLPSKITDPRWHSIAESVRQLPTCWIREDFLFWEVCWNPGEITAPELLDEVIKLCISTGKKLMLNVVPCPHPTSEKWQKRVGGPWETWMRPDFRLWEQIRETLQLAIDHCVDKWEVMNGQKKSLVFEWYNEPATGHASGGNIAKEPKGTWSKQFHTFNNYLLVGPDAITFHGYKVVGPTLSMFGEKDAERQELATVTGNGDAKWWARMSRRCVNLGLYCPEPAKTPEAAAAMYRVELERIIQRVKGLKIAVPKSPIRVHEWYVTKPMLGYRSGECDDAFRAECLVAIAEVISSYRDIEAAFFFTHFFPPEQAKTPYEDYSAFSGPMRTALTQYLRG